MEKISYLGHPNCYRLSNERYEVVVTTDVGPRIVRFGFVGDENIFGEVPEASVETELGEWKPWGGHRLWAAPEAKPRSYVPDNVPIEFAAEGEGSVWLVGRVEGPTGIQKEMRVTLDESGVTVSHTLTNRGFWKIEAAPWALTIMREGGEVILPQEPFRTWDETVLPARPLVLWHYTDLHDPRWTISPKFIRLRTDEQMEQPQKVGVLNKQGWAAYARRGTLFVKTVAYREGANYPDYGCNNETYTAGSFVELETLAPVEPLEPGMSATHVERWSLFRDFEAAASDEELEARLLPLLSGVRQHLL